MHRRAFSLVFAVLGALLSLQHGALALRLGLRLPLVTARSRSSSSLVVMSALSMASGVSYMTSFPGRPNLPIHYERHGPAGADDSSDLPILLLVPGFGVGTFHWERQFEALSKKCIVYSMDLLGQGKSWPTSAITSDDNLVYSAELWRDQIIFFIETIIKRPVHIAGNSLGGYLSVAASSHRPDLVKSLCLLNSAPFWGFAAPKGESRAFPFNIWDGTLPAPDSVLSFGSAYFNILRSRSTVQTMLTGVYKSPKAFDERLVESIIQSASPPGNKGMEAFTSILFAPKYERSFDSMLADLKRPTILLYGAEDPWIVPYWGKRAMRNLGTNAAYLSLSPSGHCPHHETPTAVNAILESWVGLVESSGTQLLASGELSKHPQIASLQGIYHEPLTGDNVSVALQDSTPSTISERFFFFFDSVVEAAKPK